MDDAAQHHDRPLGPDGQSPLRCLERRARTRALALCRWAAKHDLAPGDVADRIGIARQTLDHWDTLRRNHLLNAASRGRPPIPLQPGLSDDVQELLQDQNGRLGLPTLKHLFPQIPRTTLKDLRDLYLHEHAPHLEYLTWTRTGSVWAADFTQTPLPIDGVYPYILSLRDMASSYHLLAWPVPHPSAIYALRAFQHLFAIYPWPLVLKTDNGSHFIDQRVRDLLADANITHLLSPPATPRYNGGQEATIGSLKTRALHIAAALGRFGAWTCDDLENARLEANRQARPCGIFGPVPDELCNDAPSPPRSVSSSTTPSPSHASWKPPSSSKPPRRSRAYARPRPSMRQSGPP